MLLGAAGYGFDTWQENEAKEASRRQAVQGIALTSLMDPGTNIGPVAWRLGVLNSSTIEINVLRAALDFPDLSLQFPEKRLRPYYRMALGLPPTGVCDVGLYQRGPRSVLVQATTRDGHDVTRRVTLTPDEREELWSSMRRSCRFLRPYEALQSALIDARLTGRTLTLTYEVTNTGAVPLVFDRFSYLPGIDADVDGLPMTLRHEVAPRTLVVRFRVASCDRLVTALRRGVTGSGGDRPGTSVSVDLHHQYEAGPGELALFDVQDGIPQGLDHGLRLVRTCPQAAKILEESAFGH